MKKKEKETRVKQLETKQMKKKKKDQEEDKNKEESKKKKLLVGDGNKSSCVLAVLRLIGKKVLEDQGILILILPLANITVLSCFPDQG